MAKVKYSEEVEPINNKHYGYTFMRNHYGNSMQPASRSSRTRYSNQFQRMQNEQKAVQFWRTMSTETQTNWADFAATYPQPTKRSSVVNLSGYQLFLKRNHYLFLNSGINSNFMEAPAMEAASEPLIIFSLRLVSGRLYIIPTYSFYDSNIITQLYLNRLSSPGLFYTGTKTRYMSTAGNAPILIVNYGPLFNGYVMQNPAGFAPTGWRIPLLSDSVTLSTTLGGNSVAGGKMKETGFSHWAVPNSGADNSSGFSARGAGGRTSFSFGALTFQMDFWTQSTGSTVTMSYLRNNNTVFQAIASNPALYGKSIRLIKTDSTFVPTVTGNDGKVYNCVQIGSQIWTAENSCETKYLNGSLIPEISNQSIWNADTSGAFCHYNNNPANSYSQSDNSIDITENYLKYFGKLPAVGDILTLKYFSTTVNSAHFFPIRFVRLRVE